MKGKRDKHNRALDMYNRYKALLARGHVIHRAPDNLVMIEYRGKDGASDAAQLAGLLEETKIEAKAEEEVDEKPDPR